MEDEFEARYLQRRNIVLSVDGTELQMPYIVKKIVRGRVFVWVEDTAGISHAMPNNAIVRIDYNANSR